MTDGCMTDYLTGRAALAGIMGWPIGHSLSPHLHGFWLRFGVDPEVTDALRATVLAGLR